MKPNPGRAPYWWENLLDVIPRFYNFHGVLVMRWFNSLVVLRRPKK